MDEKLAAQVKAVNAANSYANEIYPILVEIFKPFVGQKICKQDGTLLAKYEKLIPEFPHGVALSVYKRVGDYSIYFVVKTCETIEGTCGCLYYETPFYVCDMRDGILLDVYNVSFFPIDYEVEEIEKLRREYEELEKRADNARSKLYPFGEY